MKISLKNIFDLGGPEALTWKEIIHQIALASGKRTWKIPAPVVVIKIAASILDRFKWFPVTRDQLTMLMEGNTVSTNYFDDFSIQGYLNYLPGDLDDNGDIDIFDVLNIVELILSDDNLNDYQQTTADVNFDGEVNIYDVLALVDIILSN